MNKFVRRSSWMVVTVVALVAVFSSLYLTGCDTKQDIASAPASYDDGIVLSKSNPQVQAVMAIQDKHTPGIMLDKNVVGTATGKTDDGRLAIMVYLKEAGKSKVPVSLDGVPVVTEVSGELRAMKGGGVSHKAKQTPPVQMGTSGGWRYDLANGYCCGGTLGSLVQVGGTQYVLSNYHVLYADIVSGGNSRVASAGDPVIQPGLIDISCNAANGQNVATLVNNGGSLPGANVDAGYAQVISGMVRSDGAILEVGTISSSPIAAAVGQAVKKSGRTTGLTRSSVSGLNGTFSIQYENECAGGSSFVKTFTGQIVISNSGSRFLNSGDSGSLMVQDVTSNPRPVGLLFAGSSSIAIANPIGDVLSWIGGATMVGN